MLLCRSL